MLRPLQPAVQFGFVLAVCIAASAPATAHAQRLGGQRFAPVASEDGIFDTEGADRRAILYPYVALWAHYALDPVIAVGANGARTGVPVQHVFGLDLVFSIAVWEGLEFGAALPVNLVAIGDDAAARAAGIPVAPGTSLGDVEVRVGYRIRVAENTAIALHVPVLFPSNANDDVLALGLGVRPTFALMQRIDSVELYFNVFALIRESVRVSDYHGGSELGARFGLRIDLSGRWETALLGEAELASAFDGFFRPATTPAEAKIGLEHWFDEHWRISGFVGSGIGPGVGAPDFRTGIALAFGDNVPYRPRPSATSGDRDGDGVPDRSDHCPNRPEDPDGHLDSDGCPDDDNDGDGIPDRDDACPNAPETRNHIADEDGCPDFIRVEGSLITTFEPVHFRTGSDEILPDSEPMLTEVGGVLHANPGMHVRIEGHTDNVGDPDQNHDLSQRRAESVRNFVASHGASGDQVRAVGFGQTRPVGDNDTPVGRAHNRRVEFHIERQ